MKKFTLLIVATLFATLSFAQKSVPTPRLSLDPTAIAEVNHLNNSSAKLQVKSSPEFPLATARAKNANSLSAKSAQPNKAPRSKAPSSIEDILGTYILNYESYWDQGVKINTSVTISAGSAANTVNISGWWLEEAIDLVGTVDLSAGTLTLASEQDLYEYNGSMVSFIDAYGGSSVVGNIDGGFIDFSGSVWGAYAEEGFYEAGINTVLKKANGLMAYGTNNYTVAITQSEDGATVTIDNFGMWGATVIVTINSDGTFVIEPQLVYADTQNSRNYYLYALDGDYLTEITGTVMGSALKFDQTWTAYEESGYWFGELDAAMIGYTDGTTFRTPIPNVAAIPANPEVLALSPYVESEGYGAVYFFIPTTDVDGNALLTSELYYTMYTDIEGEVQPYEFVAPTYAYVTDAMTQVPYGFIDTGSGYDFVDKGDYKIIFLNFETEPLNRIGIKSIYTGGGVTNESEISWLDLKPYTVSLAAKSVDGENYYATYYESQYARVADENTTVYTAALSSSGTGMTLTEVEGNVIPAGNAVVLKSSAETITLAYTDAEAATLENNVLEGSDEAKTVNPSAYYVLSAKDGVVGFYLFAGNQLGANKAYVPASAVASGAKVLTFDEETTGINSLLQGNASELNHVWYTIQGVRVSQPTKGVFINNGKKIIIK